ncbi:MAG: HEAT repeat domain-containing protein [Treponema sp.]|jgi:HEAT repeat protein|nr:HEAT repeat domain-containing protein [Treponema sp.]
MKKMIQVKRFFLAVGALLIPALYAAGQNNTEMSVEESFLQESVDNMIIREQSRADSREMKELALQYIGDAIESGNTSDEIRQTLEYLGLEGVLNRANENGRLVNNFPDVRWQAAEYLGKLGTPEARDTLIKMVYYDNEPAVLVSAVEALATIGSDPDGKAAETITWIMRKFDNTNPDNRLAWRAIDAYVKFGTKDYNAIQMLIRISEGPYLRPVQEKAKRALTEIRKAQAQAKQEEQQQQQRR